MIIGVIELEQFSDVNIFSAKCRISSIYPKNAKITCFWAFNMIFREEILFESMVIGVIELEQFGDVNIFSAKCRISPIYPKNAKITCFWAFNMIFREEIHSESTAVRLTYLPV